MAEAGFDLSAWQDGAYTGGGGFSFGVAKASEGIGFKDPAYDRHIAAIRASGITPGAFHFCRPDLNPNNPEGEADWFLKVVGDATGMILQCDAESAGGTAAWCLRFMQRLEARLGGYLGTLYSYLNWLQVRNFAAEPDLARYWLWFAWPSSAPMPVPLPWPRVAIQQWGLTTVPGVVGQVDADTFFGTRDELLALTVGGEEDTMTDGEIHEKIIDLYDRLLGRWAGPGTPDWPYVIGKWTDAFKADPVQARYDFGVAAEAEVPGRDLHTVRRFELDAALKAAPPVLSGQPGPDHHHDELVTVDGAEVRIGRTSSPIGTGP